MKQAGIIGSKLRLFGVAMLCAKIALVPLALDASVDMSFTVPKVLLSHAIAYVLAAVVAGLFIRFGRDFLAWSWLHVPILAFLGANVVAALFAADPVLALFGTHARMLGLGTVADGVLLYFAVALLVRTRAEAVAVIASALGASAVVLGYELVQLIGRDPVRWSTDSSVSPFSTFGQPTTLAFYLTLIAVGACALAAFAENLRWPLRTALVLYAGVLLLGGAATGTRSALLGVATGGAVLVLLFWLRTSSRRARLATALGVALAIAALAIVIVFTPLGARLTTTIQLPSADETDEGNVAELDPSTADRLVLYGIALRMLQERPLLGYGPDNFAAGVPKYRPAGAPVGLRQSVPTSAHSWAAQVATSSGLVGLAAFLAVMAVAAVSVLRSTARPLVLASAVTIGGYLGTGLTTVSDIATDALLWLSLGAIAAATARSLVPSERAPRRRASRGADRDPGGRAPFRLIGAALCLAVCVPPVLASTGALDASRSNKASQDARRVRNTAQGIESGLRATRADPGRAVYWDQLGLAYVGGSRWREATGAFDRAHQLAPYEVRYTNDLVGAQIILGLGGDAEARARALKLADQAVQADPNNPSVHLSRATVMQATSNLPQALVSVERALALDPQSVSLRLYITAPQIYLDSGRPADALRIARQGIAIFDSVEVTAKSVPLRYELARALATLGQVQEALTELDLVLKIQPNHPAAELLRAQLRAQVRN